VQRKQVSIANVQNHNPLNITFRRTLTENRWILWLQLVQRLTNVQLNDDPNVFVWGLTTSGIFTINSMYLDLIDDDTKFLEKVHLENKGTAKNQGFYVVPT
jgi:hypothetical protein